jgi:hypothetical protein
VLTTADLNCGLGLARIVLDVVVAHHTAETFVLGLIVGVSWEEGLERSLRPLRRVGGLSAALAAHLALKGGAVLKLDEGGVGYEAKQKLDHQ